MLATGAAWLDARAEAVAFAWLAPVEAGAALLAAEARDGAGAVAVALVDAVVEVVGEAEAPVDAWAGVLAVGVAAGAAVEVVDAFGAGLGVVDDAAATVDSCAAGLAAGALDGAAALVGAGAEEGAAAGVVGTATVLDVTGEAVAAVDAWVAAVDAWAAALAAVDRAEDVLVAAVGGVETADEVAAVFAALLDAGVATLVATVSAAFRPLARVLPRVVARAPLIAVGAADDTVVAVAVVGDAVVLLVFDVDAAFSNLATSVAMVVRIEVMLHLLCFNDYRSSILNTSKHNRLPTWMPNLQYKMFVSVFVTHSSA